MNSCTLCKQVLIKMTCSNCWTQCQTCGRGMNIDDCSKISVEGFEDADFCIQCSHNLFSLDNAVDAKAIIRFANAVRPLTEFLGMCNVLFLAGTRTCLVCRYRIPSNRSCCDECKYNYFIKQMCRIFPGSHALEIFEYMGAENLL
jgi:hypothetical protein